jgi:hypothetical protein
VYTVYTFYTAYTACTRPYSSVHMYLMLLEGLVAVWPHTLYNKVFGSGLSRCSPVVMASGSYQLPPSLLRTAVAHHRPSMSELSFSLLLSGTHQS